MNSAIQALVLSGVLMLTAQAGVKTDFLKKEAGAGSASAQYELGQAYQAGEGVEPDPKKAVMWYQKAAIQNHAEAQLALAMCYVEGTGVSRSNALAVEWLSAAAQRFYAPAQYMLGKWYETGSNGLEQSDEQAISWIRRAASSGKTEALVALGDYYLIGIGVTADLEKSVEWYLRAVEKGSEPAQRLIVENFSAWSDFIPEGSDAFKLLCKKAELGDADARLKLGIYYHDRNSGVDDLKQAVSLLEQASLQGNSSATKLLADIYLSEAGMKNRAAALTLYAGLAESGDMACAERLGDLYAEAGPEKDLSLSAKWYVRAAMSGRIKSQIKCIFIYGSGLGVTQSRVEAYAWASVVSEQGKPQYEQSLSPILTIEEKMAALRRYRALMREMNPSSSK